MSRCQRTEDQPPIQPERPAQSPGSAQLRTVKENGAHGTAKRRGATGECPEGQERCDNPRSSWTWSFRCCRRPVPRRVCWEHSRVGPPKRVLLLGFDAEHHGAV